MVILMMLLFLFGNFVQKWYFPQGIDWGASRIVVGDTDRDDNYELIFSTYGGSFTIYSYELHLPDVWVIDSLTDLDQPLLWDIGDFDADGFYDLVMQSSWGPPSVGLSIYESPDSFSYPTQEVWRDTAGPPLVLPISAYDIDRDGLPEIVKNRATPYGYIGIYESIGNDQYELIFADNPDTSGLEAPAATHAFGDFDGDSLNECVFAGGNEWYWVYESPANNTYGKIDEGQLPTGNIRDCFAVPDADGDGEPEFVVKGFVIPNAQIHAFIFEATADNTYEIIKTFTLPGGDYYGGYSDVGDVDGDGIPEIALEGRQAVHIIKTAGNDSFYVWETLPGNNSGSSVRVYDIDGNGLAEIIISGNNQTRIYEYQVGITEATGTVTEFLQLRISPNPFRTHTQIRYMTGANQNPVLKIYDRTGRLVKSFDLESSNGHQESGVVWDGLDKYGNPLPAGVYFVYIRSSRDEQSVPVILLR